MKVCTKCNIEKSISEFHTSKRSKSGVRSACKICTNKENLERAYLKYGAKPKKITETKTQKLCYGCNQWINKTLYYKNLNKLRTRCISCTNSENKNIRNKNINKYREYGRQYWIKNKAKCYEKNKRNRYAQLKRDPAAKLRSNVSKSISRALHRQDSSKLGESILKYLPYTMNEFKIHIESLWKPWMNWSNYGKFDPNKQTWQIDHIIPQSKLPYDSMEHENFKKCWALENLQPLETIVNIRKNANIIVDE